MMAQFLDIKAEHPDCLLFYRMGDFYELFFDDAVKASAALDITLTKRGKHNGDDIPMCGVPVHSHDSYLERLISEGFRVAVCEQTENPAEAKKRGAKSVVNRAVVRVVTPGTLTEDTLLDARRHNYLCAVAATGAGDDIGVAWIEISTGEFLSQSIQAAGLGAALARIGPGEVLISDKLMQHPDLFETLADWREVLVPMPAGRFDSANGEKRLKELFSVTALDGFGDFGRSELAAAGGLVDYIDLTQKGRLPRLAPPRRLATTETMEIDAATRRNLELTRTLAGDAKGSLLSVMDETLTGAGARLLASRLSAPLTGVGAISERLDMVQFFVDGEAVRETARGILGRCPDMQRAFSRLTLERGGPRDLEAIAAGLEAGADMRAALKATASGGVAVAVSDLGHHGDFVERLRRALGPDLPMLTRDGGFIAPGYSPELDEFRTLRDESRRLAAGLQSQYAEVTGISNLKVKHNNVLGYFIEVSAKQADNMPSGPEDAFIHRQTMANAVRYSTVELGDLEGRIARAADQALALEMKLFEDLATDTIGRSDDIATAADALARLDVSAGLGALAVKRRYLRPAIDDGTGFDISGGRHPVVEAALAARNEPDFVTNDCRLEAEGSDDKSGRLWLLTGPNMAGKSTFLRQNALIAVMAQMGSFVPAASAHIGVIDKLFSRVGAADDLARGRSTFMVEMVETAAILNQAGPRALVILDEIGRGTATFDGLSIAWAVIEHLHEENRCRALFATHYHELTALTSRLDALGCHTMKVKEWQGDVVFLHEVGPGAADRSYGIHVGEMAGLPGVVVARAEEILKTLEEGEQTSALSKLADDLPLFSGSLEVRSEDTGPSALEEALEDIHPDELSPKDALELIYRLKTLAD
ncbi:MAG: DNA mismatch repair protein MutS [Rhodospirillaceae bacterium]|nr:DNA mismatch repair protein MutS [Rhodospirillaceae bacterium]MBT4218525.1 DNA mismatch repair protein MutS [Rhodospirillaceae bacterium]MBT6406956.1 DNA mismatch repair protein MutS [Rhodospirillaceae bacterium]MBT7356507.1 DNA mismatch repair protein MutS [Rhodospirillaceae bacterium]